MNIEQLRQHLEELHRIINQAVMRNSHSRRKSNSKGSLPNLMEGDFVLFARDYFTAGEKLRRRWRGPRKIAKALSYYVFQVEDLRTGDFDDIHGSRVMFYHDSTLNTDAILSHAISSESGMVGQRLLGLVETDDGLKIRIRWKCLSESGDTDEPLQNVYDDVPELLKKLLKRKNTPSDLSNEAVLALGLYERGI